MKLRTEVIIPKTPNGKATMSLGSSDGYLSAREHDAMAAHALLQAVDTVRGYYPESVFPENGESLDSKSASMARHTCDNIKRQAEAILRQWTKQDEVK